MKQSLIVTMAGTAVQGVRVAREPLLTWKPTPPAEIPMNYFVPHFGEDRDITATKDSLAITEKAMGYKWDFPDPPAKPIP